MTSSLLSIWGKKRKQWDEKKGKRSKGRGTGVKESSLNWKEGHKGLNLKRQSPAASLPYQSGKKKSGSNFERGMECSGKTKAKINKTL